MNRLVRAVDDVVVPFLVGVLLCVFLIAGCSALGNPVYTQPIDPTTGAPVGPAVPAQNEDGTPMTVGDTIADTIDGLTPAITGTATAIGGPMGGILVAGLLAFGVGAVRNRKKNPPAS